MKTQIEESEIRYRRLFESAHEGIFILDSKTGQITDANPFLEKMLGYSKRELLNKKLGEIGAFKNSKAAHEVFEILQKTGSVNYDDISLDPKDGHTLDVELICYSYIAGDKLVFQGHVRDITERKKISVLKEAKKLLLEERLRLIALANTAHELRTPLSIIKGNIDLSIPKKKPMDGLPVIKKRLILINNEVNYLADIMSDLELITAKTWGLEIRESYEEIDLRSLIEEVAKRCEVIALKKNIKITTNSLPRMIILGDRKYLEKMFLKILDNSIIYGVKDGHVTISATKSKIFAKINFRDDGIGISDEDLPYIFDRFYQGDKSHSGIGVGLGLSIAKWVAQLHGGEVNVVNKKDKGTTISVTLPLKTHLSDKTDSNLAP